MGGLLAAGLMLGATFDRAAVADLARSSAPVVLSPCAPGAPGPWGPFGEDPRLSAELTGAAVKALADAGTPVSLAPCRVDLKDGTDGERAMRELGYPSYAAAAAAGAKPLESAEAATAALPAPEGAALARRSAVLLKNAGLLPLDPSASRSLTVSAPAAFVDALRARAPRLRLAAPRPGAGADLAVAVWSGAPRVEPDLLDAKALLWSWSGSPEALAALADVAVGSAAPEGRLPLSLVSEPRWLDGGGVFVGYRSLDYRKSEPQFPFGHGLSYSQVRWSGLKVSPSRVRSTAVSAEASLTLKNAGARPAVEVVQIYVAPEAPRVLRPVRELRAFARVALAPGESRKVVFRLDRHDFAFWDDHAHAWALDTGAYRVEAGASSRDIRLKGGLELR